MDNKQITKRSTERYKHMITDTPIYGWKTSADRWSLPECKNATYGYQYYYWIEVNVKQGLDTHG